MLVSRNTRFEDLYSRPSEDRPRPEGIASIGSYLTAYFYSKFREVKSLLPLVAPANMPPTLFSIVGLGPFPPSVRPSGGPRYEGRVRPLMAVLAGVTPEGAARAAVGPRPFPCVLRCDGPAHPQRRGARSYIPTMEMGCAARRSKQEHPPSSALFACLPKPYHVVWLKSG